MIDIKKWAGAEWREMQLEFYLDESREIINPTKDLLAPHLDYELREYFYFWRKEPKRLRKEEIEMIKERMVRSALSIDVEMRAKKIGAYSA
jgi:hypothetical protein